MLTVQIVLLSALSMMLIERWRPAQSQPRVAGWWSRVALYNGAQGAVAYVGAASWEQVLGEQGSAFGLSLEGVSGVASGYVAVTFVYYWWHRARHEIQVLWQGFHQLHHSPRRIEVATSFYKHPFELIANGLISASVLFLLLGLAPAAAAAVVLLTGLAELFYHWNVRTPRWLGYFFQRPEMHRVHHQRGRHSHNFSDLPLWDLLFGTWHNPSVGPVHCGFEASQEQRLTAMLCCRDVTRPGAGAGRAGAGR